MNWVTFKTQVTIFMPRLITFEIKAMKDVEELLGRIKQGKGKEERKKEENRGKTECLLSRGQ